MIEQQRMGAAEQTKDTKGNKNVAKEGVCASNPMLSFFWPFGFICFILRQTKGAEEEHMAYQQLAKRLNASLSRIPRWGCLSGSGYVPCPSVYIQHQACEPHQSIVVVIYIYFIKPSPMMAA